MKRFETAARQEFRPQEEKQAEKFTGKLRGKKFDLPSFFLPALETLPPGEYIAA